MLRVFHIIEIINDVSRRRYDLIQLILQVYLLASSLVTLSVGIKILDQQVHYCFDEDASSQIQAVDRRAETAMNMAGLSMVVYGAIQVLRSILCIIQHNHCYTFFRMEQVQEIYIRIQTLASGFLLLICVFTLTLIILLINFLNGEAMKCLEHVQSLNGLGTWLPAIVPLFVMDILAHLYNCVFFLTTKAVHDRQSPIPRIRLVSTHSDIGGPRIPSITITQPVDFIQNPIDSFHRIRRPRLPSLRNLHVAKPGSPISILFEIPLTPQQMNESPTNQNESNVPQSPDNLPQPDVIGSSEKKSETFATNSFEYPNIWINHQRVSSEKEPSESDDCQLNYSDISSQRETRRT